MDAKTELIGLLCDALPGGDCGVLDRILANYSITKKDDGRSNLNRRIKQFLNAKKIDGLSAKTLQNYQYSLGTFARQIDKHVSKIATDDIRDYLAYLYDVREIRESSVQALPIEYIPICCAIRSQQMPMKEAWN